MVATRPAVIPPTDRSGAGVRPPGVERPEPGARDAIAVSGLRKEFAGGIVAVDGIDLAVREGEIFAFLGPNGAGKTTTVLMLTTLLRRTAGRASVSGFDVDRGQHAIRRSIGVALQEAGLDALPRGGSCWRCRRGSSALAPRMPAVARMSS